LFIQQQKPIATNWGFSDQNIENKLGVTVMVVNKKFEQALAIINEGQEENRDPEQVLQEIMDKLKVDRKKAAEFFYQSFRQVRDEERVFVDRRHRRNVREYLSSIGKRTQSERLMTMKKAFRVVRNDPERVSAREIMKIVNQIDRAIDRLDELTENGATSN
jgi:hypothetical protein